LEEIIYFGEIMDIWAKERKEKSKKNYNNMKGAAILSLARPNRKKTTRKQEEKGYRLTHIKKYSSFLFLSNCKLRKYFVGIMIVELENIIIRNVKDLIFIFENLCNMERRGRLD